MGRVSPQELKPVAEGLGARGSLAKSGAASPSITSPVTLTGLPTAWNRWESGAEGACQLGRTAPRAGPGQRGGGGLEAVRHPAPRSRLPDCCAPAEAHR